MSDAMSEYMDAQQKQAPVPTKKDLIKAQRRELRDKWREWRKNPPQNPPLMSQEQFVRHVQAHILTPSTRKHNTYSLVNVPVPLGYSRRQLNKVARRVWKRRRRHPLWQDAANVG